MTALILGGAALILAIGTSAIKADDEVLLRAELIDSGVKEGKDYVMLRFPEISCFTTDDVLLGGVEEYNWGMAGASLGDVVYTTIWKQKRYWAPGASAPYKNIPWDDVRRNGKKFIKGRVHTISDDGSMCVTYGIEKYVVSESNKQLLDSLNKELIAGIRLDNLGNATLEKLKFR